MVDKVTKRYGRAFKRLNFKKVSIVNLFSLLVRSFLSVICFVPIFVITAFVPIVSTSALDPTLNSFPLNEINCLSWCSYSTPLESFLTGGGCIYSGYVLLLHSVVLL